MLTNLLNYLKSKLPDIFNYLGQLRFYSYCDLILLFLWLKTPNLGIILGSFLWFGFLVFLDFFHEDKGRRKWHWSVWGILWLVSLLILINWIVILFFLVCFFYTLKKKWLLGYISPLTNGAIKTILACVVADIDLGQMSIIFITMTLRNLAGDVRDAGKDFEEGVYTIPIICGYKKNTNYIYPVFLILTSTLWVYLGNLPIYYLLIVFFVQRITYNWTPR